MRNVVRIARWATLTVLCVGALAFLTLYAPYFVMHQLPFMGTAFSPAQWAEAGNCSGLGDWPCEQKWMQCERGKMYRSLASNHLFAGRTRRTEATALLGSGTVRSVKDNNCVNYRLGYCSGMGIDLDYLELCFDGNEVLRSVRHFQS